MERLVPKLIKFNKLLSWILLDVTIVMVSSGYAMTFIGVNIPSFRAVHIIFDVLFASAFLSHLIITTFVLRFNWRTTIGSLASGTIANVTLLRVIQRFSGFIVLIFGGFQILTGLDWFKFGLSSLLPYPIHRINDFYLLLSLIVHTTIGVHFAIVRRRAKLRLSENEKISQDRREALALIGGSVIALLSSILLGTPPKVGTGSSIPSGVLPPGQSEIEKLKVLHTGIGIPPYDPDTWRFEVYGLVDNPVSLNCDEFKSIPSVIRVTDFHCVTGWTKFANKWEGVSFKTILDMAKIRHNAKYATIECLRGYTTSLPILALLHQDVLFAYRLDDQELPREHGGPLRLVVPQKYGYKSAKWVIKVKFTEIQELGYWEKRGYSNTANPFTNDRYSG
jgi:hypothetical protein